MKFYHLQVIGRNEAAKPWSFASEPYIGDIVKIGDDDFGEIVDFLSIDVGVIIRVKPKRLAR